jgi:hypothetical protein
MKLCYFVVDGRGQLMQVRRAKIEALWRGDLSGADLGSEAGNELRLVSVLCDKRIRPKKIYLLRLPLSGGQFTPESYLTLRIFSRSDCVTPQEVIRHHTDGWPCDIYKQLAVALDVPRSALDVPLGIGGPLLLAAAMKVSPRQAVKYLR